MHPAGLPPANSPFEAEDDNNFTTDAEMEPMERLALSWGKCARQFTKLLLSLLSHIGETACHAATRSANADRYWPVTALSSYRAQPFATCCADGEGWWAATVLPRALRFKRPLHRCNACDPNATRRRS